MNGAMFSRIMVLCFFFPCSLRLFDDEDDIIVVNFLYFCLAMTFINILFLLTTSSFSLPNVDNGNICICYVSFQQKTLATF
jgi:hypothetical protein